MTEPQYQPPTDAPIEFGAEPPVRKKKRWPWVLGGILLVGLMLLGGCMYFAYKSPAGAGTTFATHIERGDTAEAYNLLCEKSKAELDPDEFEENHVPSQDVTSIELVTASVNPSGDTDVFTVRYKLADGTEEVVEYDMVKENGSWRVCDPPTIE